MELTSYQNLIEKHRSEFETYFSELVSYNDKVNLTAITERHDVFTKHFLDSVLAVDAIPIDSKVIDIGAGAGFPGLPLKIVRPDIDLTMVDSLKKRVIFLDYLCDKLKIKSNNVHARAEEYCEKNREIFDVAIARAVAKLNTLLEYLLPFVKVGGIVIAYKGSNFYEEVEDSQSALETLGGKFIKDIRFDLPNGYGERHLLVIEKIKETPKQYPRGKNYPKLHPLR